LKKYLEKCEEIRANLSHMDIHYRSIERIIIDYDKDVSNVSAKLSKIKLDTKDLLLERDEYQKKVQVTERYKIDLDYQRKEIENNLKRHTETTKSLNDEKKGFEDEVLDGIRKLDVYLASIKEIEWMMDKTKKGIEVLEFWKIAFSPKGIRALLLDRFCNEMNEKVNDYLSSISSGYMSLVIKPTSTLKSGEERNKLGLDIRMKQEIVKYESLSGGEKRRVDISLCLGLNKWISDRFDLKKGLLGFMVLDEVFSFLDDSAEETIGSLLNQEGLKRAIFVISHTTELQNYTNNKWLVSKTNGISKLEAIND
jgi:DNA repair exonuclease SbcCD ATPase subunit